jgi:hypothetical protein
MRDVLAASAFFFLLAPTGSVFFACSGARSGADPDGAAADAGAGGQGADASTPAPDSGDGRSEARLEAAALTDAALAMDTRGFSTLAVDARPPDLVSADAAVPEPAGIGLQLPAAPPVGIPFPVLVHTTDRSLFSGRGTLSVGASSRPIDVRRGRGSASAILEKPGPVSVRVTIGRFSAEVMVTAVARPRRMLKGTLSGADLRWDATQDVQLTETVQIPAGARLLIEAGATVLGGPLAGIDVAGELVASGTAERPILFSRADTQPWGGILVGGGARAEIRNALFTQGGGDPSRHFGHRIAGMRTQPLVHAAGGEVIIERSAFVDAIGKGPSGSSAGGLVIRDTLLSRIGQGVETTNAEVLIERSHFLEIPDADGVVEGDDSDGVHLGPSRTVDGVMRPCAIRDSVFAVIEDDAIDHQATPLTIERVWIENIFHEAIAASDGNRITIEDSVITLCGQGIEAGWGRPEVVVKNVIVAGCGVGLRWGDEYTMANLGTLSVSYTAVVQGVAIPGTEAIVFRPTYRNLLLNRPVHNWSDGLRGPGPDNALTIACSMVDSSDWNGRNDNAPGSFTFDVAGCVRPARVLPGCPDGPIGPRCD